MKKIIVAAISAAILMTSLIVPAFAAEGESVVALGADLSAEDRAVALELLGTSEDALAGQTVLTVTSEDAHKYLDGYLPQDVIGTNALSCCRLVPAESGSGISVTTKNINYVTADMYKSALATAGVEDADVTVVSPHGATGTTALVGMLMAYGAKENILISAEKIDAAVGEMITTGQIGEAIEDPEKAVELVAAVKKVVAAKKLTNEDDIDTVITDIASELDVTLSDSEKHMIIDLMKKLSGIKLDPDMLSKQAGSIYERLTEKGIDLQEYGVSQSEMGGFLGTLAKLWNALMDFFRNLVG